MQKTIFFSAFIALMALCGCQSTKTPLVVLDEGQLAIVEELSLDAELIAALEGKPLYQFSPEELNVYLGFLQKDEPDLRKRVARIGRKNLGQPYELYLLGEFPYETYDPQPLYCLEKSDCVVFAEHTYAMALSHDWPTFFAMLQRIRYINGEISVVSRNHYTELDWDQNNSWLVKDISAELAGEATASYTTKFNKARFLKNRYKLDTDIEPVKLKIDYVPFDKVADVLDGLNSGDFVNVIRGKEEGGGAWAGHVGLIYRDEEGTVNFLHSTRPQVKEQPLLDYIAQNEAKLEQRKAEGKSFLKGFKFLRLEENPIENLKAIDGPDAPILFPPALSHIDK
jgi:N-acetylmuramoyl-L-alanine amidase-like